MVLFSVSAIVFAMTALLVAGMSAAERRQFFAQLGAMGTVAALLLLLLAQQGVLGAVRP